MWSLQGQRVCITDLSISLGIKNNRPSSLGAKVYVMVVTQREESCRNVEEVRRFTEYCLAENINLEIRVVRKGAFSG